ncbi:hypothetical protein KM043_009681 [Ampulex compressa]|nr:hypothetical protein KM043_009681 [Ampulex compressa]
MGVTKDKGAKKATYSAEELPREGEVELWLPPELDGACTYKELKKRDGTMLGEIAKKRKEISPALLYSQWLYYILYNPASKGDQPQPDASRLDELFLYGCSIARLILRLYYFPSMRFE